MVFPRNYANGDSTKVVMTIQLIVLFVGSIVCAVQSFFLSGMVWTSTDITAANIPYYDTLPSNLKVDWMIGINNVIYFVFALIKVEWLLFVVVSIITIIVARRTYMFYVSVIISGLLTMIMTVRALFFAISWFDCENWAFCRTTKIPYLPYSALSKNIYFQLVLFGTLALVLVQVISLILLYFLNTTVTKLKVEEELNGVVENPYGINFLCPAFFVPDDGVKIYITLLYMLSAFFFVLFFITNWYLDRFIWTSSDLPVDYIPYYAILDSWMKLSSSIGFGDVIYIILSSFRLDAAFYCILGLIVISGCKRKYTYPIVKMSILGLIIMSTVRVGFFTWCWFDFINWPVARTTVSPYSINNRNFYFEVVWILSIITVLASVLLIILIYAFELTITTVIKDEDDSGVIQVNGDILTSDDEEEGSSCCRIN